MSRLENFLIPIARFFFFSSTFVMLIINFVKFDLAIKQILAPIMLLLFGLSLFIILFLQISNLREIDFEYFRNIMIGIAGGLAVWFASTIRWDLINDDPILGVSYLIGKIGISFVIIYLGFLICRRKNEKQNRSKHYV